MPLSTYPLIAWGASDDISAYTQVGTAGVTVGVADPFGGTGAYTIDDNDAAAAEYRMKAPVFAVDQAEVWITLAIKQATASASEFGLFDSTAVVQRGTVQAAWSGGVPTLTYTNGGGRVLPPIALGAGWYAVVFSATGVLAANANRLRLFGALATAASVGSTSYYVRNMVLLDLIDNAASFKRPAAGYRTHRNSAGVRESYRPGADLPMFTGRCRHVPQAPEADPGKSGWYGENESIGINCGVLAMLTAGWDAQLLRFVKDRSNCASGVDAYLGSQPAPTWRPDFERSWQYAFELELETASLVTGV